MGRQLRPALPGGIFHLTARTQWQEPLFRGAEAEIANLIMAATTRSDATLLAYAVMSNHIHIVAAQGVAPLSRYMQPLLRRIALVIKRRHARVGHVFAGRYRHNVCLDPEYFRSIVAYVHLNPVRAGLCLRPERYCWTSHGHYVAAARSRGRTAFAIAVEDALRVFAARSSQPIEACARDYRRYVQWRVAMDRYLEAEPDSWVPIPRPPRSIGGDLHWHSRFGTASALRTCRAALPAPRTVDLRDHVCMVLDDVAPDLPLQQLRDGGRGRQLVRIRRQVIARALVAGYSGSRVAAFLSVSPSSVSAVRATLGEQHDAV
jgi:REP element-mobilizing transposase RayT